MGLKIKPNSHPFFCILSKWRRKQDTLVSKYRQVDSKCSRFLCLCHINLHSQCDKWENLFGVYRALSQQEFGHWENRVVTAGRVGGREERRNSLFTIQCSKPSPGGEAIHTWISTNPIVPREVSTTRRRGGANNNQVTEAPNVLMAPKVYLELLLS